MPPGLIDTSVFIHAQTYDALAEECLRFLEALQRGEVEARLEPLVLHELSYALPHYRKRMTRKEVSEYLLAVLAWKGITGDKHLLASAVERWRDSAGLAYIDAYLAALAIETQSSVYTKNIAELEAQGVVVPNQLPQ